MKIVYLAVLGIMLSYSGYSFSEGGKVRNPNILPAEEGCFYVVPEDTEECGSPAPSHSGFVIYTCDETIIVCPEDDEDEDEDNEVNKFPIR